MKSSRVLVAVLAVLCLSAMSSAAVIDVPGTNYSSIGGYTTYTQGLGTTYCGQGFSYYAQYDISDVISDPSVAIVSAKLVYSREYTNSPTVQCTMTVAEPFCDYTLDTGTNSGTAYHKALIGGNRDAAVLTGVRFASAAEVVNNPAAGNGPYAGNQSVDVTAIVQDWKNGAASYGDSLGMYCSPFQQGLFHGDFLPYLEVVTAPVPEPVTMGLLAVGGIATLLRRRRNA